MMEGREGPTGTAEFDSAGIQCRGREHPLPEGAPKVVGGGDAFLVIIQCRSQGGGPQVCRKVVRACSQPQGMFLQFETRRFGVGECAQPIDQYP
jgi:hypothetical protein